MSAKYAKRCEEALHDALCRVDNLYDKVWGLMVSNPEHLKDTKQCTHMLVVLSGINELRRLHRNTSLMFRMGRFPDDPANEARDYLSHYKRVVKLHSYLIGRLKQLKG